MENDNLIARLHHFAATRPDHTALTFLVDGDTETRTLTFAGLEQAARRVAALLLARAPQARRALLLHPPGPEFIAALCGCWLVGITPVPSYPPSHRLGSKASTRFARLAADVDAQLALTDAASFARVWQAASAGGVSGLQWLATDDPADAIAPLPDLNDLPRLDAPALIQYTSGSTGAPRGVCLSHANLSANLRAIAKRYELTADSRIVSWLPPYHDMGLIGCILPVLACGVHLIQMEPRHFLQRPLRWLEAISRYRGTSSASPNFAYELCAEHAAKADLSGLDLSSWRTACCGAETVRASSLRDFARQLQGCGFSPRSFKPSYGLAEATLLVTSKEPDDDISLHSLPDAEGRATERVSCGPAADGIRLAIVDPRTQQRCPEDTPGEIWIAGPSVSAGYWHQDEANRELFGQPLPDDAGPWLRSGDLGYLHGGELFVTGRLKDLIIVRGRNLYPSDLEGLATSSHPALESSGAAAFGADTGSGEALVIACELRRDYSAPPEPAMLQRAIQAALTSGLDTRADAIVLLPPGSLPRTTSGKIRRSAARNIWLKGGWDTVVPTATARPAQPLSAAEQTLLRCLGLIAGIDAAQINPDWTLGELGIDSLKRVELALVLEHELGRTLDVECLTPQLSLRELARLSETAARPVAEAATDADGELPLSPAQRAFLEAGVANPRDFIEIVYLRTPPGLDPAALRLALEWIAARHDAFRLRFHPQPGTDGPKWRQTLDPKGHGIGFERIDATTLPVSALYDTLQARVRQTVDLTHGPLAHAVWLDRGERTTGVLGLAFHHLIIDAVSLAIFVTTLQQVHARLLQGERLEPARRSDGLAAWLQARHAQADSPARQAEIGFWESVCGAKPAAEAAPVAPKRLETCSGVSLSAPDNRRFLERFPDSEARHDALLAAFAAAWARVMQDEAPLIQLEHHGRQRVDGVSPGTAIGWFITHYPVRIRVDTIDPLALYDSVRQTVAAVPDKGAGYALLRHAARAPETRERIGRLRQADLSMDYRGAIDEGYRRDSVMPMIGNNRIASAWEEARIRTGTLPSLGMSASISAGQLGWGLFYDPDRFSAAQVTAMGREIEQFVHALLDSGVEEKNAHPTTAADEPVQPR